MENLNSNFLVPEKHYFKDDGNIPNSKYPLLLYRAKSEKVNDINADWLENTFNKYNWTNSWRWGVYDFHHYHSNTHEVLGVFQGNAKLLLGGEQGKIFNVRTGDVIVIPAGVGHKCLSHSIDFEVVGAYPNGASADMKKGETGERPQADQNISQTPIPDTDPISGLGGPLINIWKEATYN